MSIMLSRSPSEPWKHMYPEEDRYHLQRHLQRDRCVRTKSMPRCLGGVWRGSLLTCRHPSVFLLAPVGSPTALERGGNRSKNKDSWGRFVSGPKGSRKHVTSDDLREALADGVPWEFLSTKCWCWWLAEAATPWMSERVM